MRQVCWTALLCILLSQAGYAQVQSIYSLKEGKVSFYAGTPVEDIAATNTRVTSFLNLQTGDLLISIPNQEFKFRRALMQEHFNENYMETEKYPKSEFKGKIVNVSDYDFTSATPFRVKVEGMLTVHGVAKPKTLEVLVKNTAGNISGETKFIIPLEDHQIKRPKILWEKIAENVEVTAQFTYQAYKQ